MGNSVTQNCQRGTIFFTFLAFTVFAVISIINLVKNRIDPVEGEEGEEPGNKYKEGQGDKPQDPPPRKKEEKLEEGSNIQFDKDIKDMKATKVEDDDPVPVQLAKKNEEFETFYFPILIVFILNILTGTSKAFCFVDFFATIIVVLLFNVGKLHRKCMNHIFANIILENLWLFLVFFAFVNAWGAFTIGMPYIVI